MHDGRVLASINVVQARAAFISPNEHGSCSPFPLSLHLPCLRTWPGQPFLVTPFLELASRAIARSSFFIFSSYYFWLYFVYDETGSQS